MLIFALMKLKLHIDWKKALVFLIVSAGLIYLTRSIWLSIAIFLVLFIIDGLLSDWDSSRRLKKEIQKWKDEAEKKERSGE